MVPSTEKRLTKHFEKNYNPDVKCPARSLLLQAQSVRSKQTDIGAKLVCWRQVYAQNSFLRIEVRSSDRNQTLNVAEMKLQEERRLCARTYGSTFGSALGF